MAICVFVCVFFCPFIFEVPFNFPTSRSRMSNIFRDSESLGKSNKKKKGFLCILGPPYCGIGATIRVGREILCLPYAGFFIVHNTFWRFSLQTYFCPLLSCLTTLSLKMPLLFDAFPINSGMQRSQTLAYSFYKHCSSVLK